MPGMFVCARGLVTPRHAHVSKSALQISHRKLLEKDNNLTGCAPLNSRDGFSDPEDAGSGNECGTGTELPFRKDYLLESQDASVLERLPDPCLLITILAASFNITSS